MAEISVIPIAATRFNPSAIKDAKISSGKTSSHYQKVNVRMESAQLEEMFANQEENLGELLSTTNLMSLRNLRKDNTRNIRRGFSKDLEALLDHNAAEKIRIMAIPDESGMDFQDFMRQARFLFPDSTDFILALQEFLRTKRLKQETAERIQAAIRAEIEKKTRKLFQADINAAFEAKRFANLSGLHPKHLRDAYRLFIQSGQDEALMYSHFINQFGFAHRAFVLDFLAATLSYESQANDAAFSKEEFGLLLDSLSRLRWLRSADAQLLSRMRALYGRNMDLEEEEELIDLMIKVLKDSEQLIPSLKALFNGHLRFMNKRRRRSLIQGLLRVFTDIPLALQPDEEVRQALLKRLENMMTELAMHGETKVGNRIRG